MSLLRILSDDRNRFVDLQLNEYVESHYPSVCLEVTVSCGAFAGANSQIWVGTENINRFLVGCRQLERTRKGVAVLESMSPGEFELRIEPVDSLGHFRLCFVVGRDEISAQSANRQRLTGSFDLDSEFLGSLDEGFRVFFSRIRNSS
jgi:hypothetical protein